MWQDYYSVSGIDEALRLLQDHGSRARIIAGGTDLLIELEQQKRPDVDVLIDITRVPGLDEIKIEEGAITLGPLVNHNHVVADARLRRLALPLVQACWEVGAPQIRNRATIAGNLITASPANDTIVPLMALDAVVVLTSAAAGEREIPLRAFYTGLRQSVMRPDEMLTAIRFQAIGERERGVFIKLGLRRAQAISVVNIAAVLTFTAEETISHASITMGSVAPMVIRLREVEEYLIGQPLVDGIIREAARIAATIPRPIDDVRSTAAYRSEMVKVLASRALRQLIDDPVDPLPENPALLWGDSEARVNGNRLTDRQHHKRNGVIRSMVNGQSVETQTGSHKTLLHWLREEVGLTGTKEGCSEGECGACTVWLDGAAVMACMVPAPRAHQAEITTIEGLQQDDALHPLQDAFIEHAAVQCGYCTPGLLMAGARLLAEQPRPSDAQIQQSISGNLCRCTGYYKIVDAFRSASSAYQSGGDDNVQEETK